MMFGTNLVLRGRVENLHPGSFPGFQADGKPFRPIVPPAFGDDLH